MEPIADFERPIKNVVYKNSLLEVFLVALRLGLTSFGGPIAHLGYFYDEYIKRRKWMDEQSYADLVALCQFLPGPASTKVGIALGTIRRGWFGGIVAWLGFTLPSAIIMMIVAYVLYSFGSFNTGWGHGLKLVSVAVVSQAVVSMGRSLAPDRSRATIAIGSAFITLLWGSSLIQISVILLSGFIGFLLYKNVKKPNFTSLTIPISRTTGLVSWLLFFSLLFGLPLLRQMSSNQWIAMFDSFYRVGALVFGGGHVILPLIEKEVVPTGWVSQSQFITGYGVAQAIPGPLSTFAAYLGVIIKGWVGAVVATVAIFLPCILLVFGSLPFWEFIRKKNQFQAALYGINAAVVGVLISALYNPIWTGSITSPVDFGITLISFCLLVFWKLPPWSVVAITAGLAEFASLIY